MESQEFKKDNDRSIKKTQDDIAENPGCSNDF